MYPFSVPNNSENIFQVYVDINSLQHAYCTNTWRLEGTSFDPRENLGKLVTIIHFILFLHV